MNELTPEILRISYPQVEIYLKQHPNCRLLFLDIDGVLNSETYFAERVNGKNYADVDEAAVARLNRLDDVVVIISSSWGYNPETINMLKAHGLKPRILAGICPWYTSYGQRGKIIDLWCRTFLANYPYIKYAIVDDDNDMLESQQDIFVRTDFWHGLTDSDVERLKTILQ